MVDFVSLSMQEKEILLQHYRKAQNQLIKERAHAILLNDRKKTPYEIAQILFRTEKTVREWIKRFHLRRISTIFPSYNNNQNAAKLTKAQKLELLKVLSQPPSEYGIPYKFWEVKSLRSYIKAYFGVEYESDESYRLVFKLLNFFYHLPNKFNIKRDGQKIERRIRQIKEEIKPYLKDNRWVVLASDETRVVLEAIIRRLWLPKGQKSILKVKRDNQYQNFIGFLNLKTGRQHLFEIKKGNQEEIIKSCLKIKKLYPKKKLCLIWDNAAYHRGKKIRHALKTGILKDFYLINFPPYAPDKNPEEYVWKYGKDKIANYQFSNMVELVKTFKQIITGRIYPYQI